MSFSKPPSVIYAEIAVAGTNGLIFLTGLAVCTAAYIRLLDVLTYIHRRLNRKVDKDHEAPENQNTDTGETILIFIEGAVLVATWFGYTVCAYCYTRSGSTCPVAVLKSVILVTGVLVGLTFMTACGMVLKSALDYVKGLCGSEN